MGCGLTSEDRTNRYYQKLAALLPFNKGTIIRPDGSRIDICDVMGVPKTPADPQLAKAQNVFPYIRDTVLLENGQTCSLLDMVNYVVDKFSELEEIDNRFSEYLDEIRSLLVRLKEYIDWVEEQAGLVYTSELRLDPYTLSEGDWSNGS